jgi:hypothetical protein
VRHYQPHCGCAPEMEAQFRSREPKQRIRETDQTKRSAVDRTPIMAAPETLRSKSNSEMLREPGERTDMTSSTSQYGASSDRGLKAAPARKTAAKRASARSALRARRRHADARPSDAVESRRSLACSQQVTYSASPPSLVISLIVTDLLGGPPCLPHSSIPAPTRFRSSP